MATPVSEKAWDTVSRRQKKKRPPVESDDLWKLLHDGSDHIKEALRSKEDNYTLGLADLAELDALLRPHLLAWCRLVFPMGYRSFRGDYWIVPQGYIKIHIPTGATWHLGVITQRKKPELFLRGISPLHHWIGHVQEDYRTAYRSLKAWAIAQQSVPVEEESPFHFHGPPDYVVKLFWWVMFSGFRLGGKELPETLPHYKGTAKDLWKIFRKFYGPIRTKREPDFNSYYRLKRLLQYCLENPPVHFRVSQKIDRTKTEVWEVHDNWYSPSPAIKKMLAGQMPPGGLMSETRWYTDQQLLEFIEAERNWKPPPVDKKMAAHLKKFREDGIPNLPVYVKVLSLGYF